jgi:hypothetical protein
MRPSAALQLLVNRRVLLLLTTLLVVSVFLGTAAVARSGGGLFAFSRTEQAAAAAAKQPSQPQPDQPQAPLPQAPKPEAPKPQAPQPAAPTTTAAQPAAPQPTAAKEPPRPEDIEEYKYFHEAGFTHELQHYDVRFFTAEVPYTAHRAVLTNLIRSYLSTFASLHLETWIAHGTLLGWYWNEHILPWDFDVDVQVSGATLAQLATQYNQSRHEYAYTDAATGKPATETYLLDVNTFATKVDRGSGHNSIDARWIDVATGMYVDITGLMERDPKKSPGVVSCKNFHAYRQEELFPLRESTFEGVPALVPFEYKNILAGEYQEKSMVVTEFQG